MVFNSLEYAVFLPVVLLIYWRLGHREQNVLLLVASYVFYAAFDWRFLGLMLLTTATDYIVGRALDTTTSERVRRAIFLVSLGINLGVLAFFKYFNFFIDGAGALLGRLGLQPHLPTLRVLLPIGISFYTFHGISYTFDIYRRHIRPARSLLTFAVFVAFFPQLVAGPIGRAHLQLPQFERERVLPRRDSVISALSLILIGLFKKVAIADAIAPYVTDVFASPGSAGWLSLVVAMFGFCLQIYGDFAGYTDIARGSSRLLGVELPVNFEQPYLSSNITEFWRRWHISLSRWLRDYLYIPLGGSRGSKWTTYRNLMITMFLGGLWHGAALTFVVWGGIHGALLVLHRRWTARKARPDAGASYARRRSLAKWPAIAATFTVVAAAFVVFRASSLGDAVAFFNGIVTLRAGALDPDALVTVSVGAIALFALDGAQRRLLDDAVLTQLGPASRGVLVGVMLTALVVFSGANPVPFIYFQF